MKYFLPIFAMLFLATACDTDDAVEPHEEELITSLYVDLTADGVEPVTFRFIDLDGEGGQAPVVSAPPIQANLTYNASIRVQNDAEMPAELITEEIQEEDDEHQFFFELSGINGTIVYTDEDENGQPVGLSSLITISDSASTGTLKITLVHEPNKDGENVAAGDITNAGGETDIEVTFDVVTN